MSTDGFNYKAVSCTVAEIWLFEISDTNLTLTYFIKVILNNVTDAHLQCILIMLMVSITRLYLVRLLSYGYLKIPDLNLTLTYLSRSF